jgi:hypothetical protein
MDGYNAVQWKQITLNSKANSTKLIRTRPRGKGSKMEVPEVFNIPGARFVFMDDGSKYPPCEAGWQLPGHGHIYEEALAHPGNVGFLAGSQFGEDIISIGLDQDAPEVFQVLSLPPTTTWETRPGRLGMQFVCSGVPAELMAEYGKPADYSQFKFYKDGLGIGELKLERCYQVIPNSWKTLDSGEVVSYQMVDSRPPAYIDLGALLHSIMDIPGVSLKKNGKGANSWPSEPASVDAPIIDMAVEPSESPVDDEEARRLAYSSAALLKELGATEQAPESTRYDQVYKSGCALGELIEGGLLPEVPTFNALVEAGVKSGLPTYKVIESATNGINQGKKNPRKMPAPTTQRTTCTPPPAGYSGHDLDGMLWVEGKKLDTQIQELTDEEFNAYRMPCGPKFSINLPPENYISRFMAYGDEISDAYCDFWLAGALVQLAVVSDKKIRVELRQGTLYANVYISINGKSSLARKSTVAQKVEDILIIIRPSLLSERVPTEFSPEAFTEHMDKFQHAPWIRDEAAGVLSLMKRDYMKGFKDCMTSLYDCKPYDRKLRTSQRKAEKTTFNVHDPFLNLFWATTDASFAANTELNDTLSGFLARFLFFFPQGKKLKFMPLQEGNEAISAMETVVIDQLRTIVAKIDSMERTVLHIAPDAAAYWEKWQKTREDEATATNDGASMQIFSRMNPTVIKLAMLFELAQPGFDASHPIRREFVVEACRLIDDYLIPTAKAMYDLVGSNVEKNYIDQIMGHLRNHEGKATKNEILRAVRIKSKDFSEYVSTMIECHMVRLETYSNHGKGRDTQWLFLEEQPNVSKIAIIPEITKITKITEQQSGVIEETPVILDTLATLVIQGISELRPKDGVECKDVTIPVKPPVSVVVCSPEIERIRAGHQKHTTKQKRTCHICGYVSPHDLNQDMSSRDYVNAHICASCLISHRVKSKVQAEVLAAPSPQTSLGDVV